MFISLLLHLMWIMHPTKTLLKIISCCRRLGDNLLPPLYNCCISRTETNSGHCSLGNPRRASLPEHRALILMPGELTGAVQSSRMHQGPTTVFYNRTSQSASLQMKWLKRRKKLSEPCTRERRVCEKDWSSIRVVHSSIAALFQLSNQSKSQRWTPAAGPSGRVTPCTPLSGHHTRQQPHGKKARFPAGSSMLAEQPHTHTPQLLGHFPRG